MVEIQQMKSWHLRYKTYYVKIFFSYFFLHLMRRMHIAGQELELNIPLYYQKKGSLGDKIENLQLSEAVLFNLTQHRVKTAFQVWPSEYVFASGRRLDRQMNESVRCWAVTST